MRTRVERDADDPSARTRADASSTSADAAPCARIETTRIARDRIARAFRLPARRRCGRIDAPAAAAASRRLLRRGAGRRDMAALPLARHAAASRHATPANRRPRAPTRCRQRGRRRDARRRRCGRAEHDIERLTDRVIGSIDRRIVAQRERFGRP